MQIKCVELEKCSECNLESVSNKLYIKTTKPYNFYFDTENKDYEPCYETSFKWNNKRYYLNNNILHN